MTSRKIASLVALGAASVLLLAGCAGTAGAASTPGASGAKLTVVASTNVYGQIAQEIGGGLVDVTSIVSSGSQDPHGYEASAQDQLTISKADLIIENGAGYDAFVDALITSSGTTAPVITASELSHAYPAADASAAPTASADAHDHAHVEGFNEHVWYDPHTIEAVATAIADQLGTLDPANAAAFTANATTFTDGVHALETSLEAIKTKDAGAGVFVTEPVPVYLIDAAGLQNITPSAFSSAVEAGQDVPPATILEARSLIDGGTVKVLIANAQTGGAETTQVIDAATAKNIPVLEFTETLPDGKTYLQWMQQNIDDLAAALAA
ncbi:metal ABC transporter solute-binding protein, Zn/Mn family [Microbacterium sp. CJ88]|uniref:metal ABC transporter solute-binding protein, Zn/Mn family n=1 Tax=Microbacterium sp. CJ88 TaxID=3445672 RepID=UPI003F655977